MPVYAPQVGCDEEEKETFWEEMTLLVYRGEKIWIGGLNGHVKKGNKNRDTSCKAPFKRSNMSPTIDVERTVGSFDHHVGSPNIDISDVG